MLTLSLGGADQAPALVLAIGAHADDIEIGCGGTLLALQQQYPDCRIHWLVLTSVPERRMLAGGGSSGSTGTPTRMATAGCPTPPSSRRTASRVEGISTISLIGDAANPRAVRVSHTSENASPAANQSPGSSPSVNNTAYAVPPSVPAP